MALLSVSAPATSAAQPRAKPFRVGRLVRAWVDSSRQSWQGQGSRPLQTIVWYPTDDSVSATDWVRGPAAAPYFRLGSSSSNAPIRPNMRRRPLVVLSHGNGGSGAMLGWLGEALASAGYIVAAVDHHGNTSNESTHAAAGFVLWWERATDVSAVIDRILADSIFGPRIDAHAIGAAGFALGGYTALELAGARTNVAAWRAFCRSDARDAHDGFCGPQPEFPDLDAAFAKVRDDPLIKASLARESMSFRDGRIRGIYVMAPLGRMLTEASLAGMRIPARIVVGKDDHTAPARTNGQYLAARIPAAQLRLLADAGHYTFIAECTSAGTAQFPELCQESAPHRGAMHRLVATDALRFFDRVLRPGRQAVPPSTR
jgi:predicted dienelactone hydrolase